MLFGRSASKGSSRDEAEKPFWISYADLMTALMVLFLVVMTVALLAVTKTVSEAEAAKVGREKAIEACMRALGAAAKTVEKDYPGIVVNQELHTIHFGERARFARNSATLTIDQQNALRRFAPQVLDVASEASCGIWLRRVVVEGFTDRTGTYLHNLRLSLDRSESVICALLDPAAGDESIELLTLEQLERIRKLFVIGGYSFSSLRPTDDESRRVELLLEFYASAKDDREPQEIPDGKIGTCRKGG